MAYQVVITDLAREDTEHLRAYDRKAVLEAIEAHLTHQPKQLSRSRIKRLVQPAISEYRLRVGEFRVYYDLDEGSGKVVVLQVYKKGQGTTSGEEDT